MLWIRDVKSGESVLRHFRRSQRRAGWEGALTTRAARKPRPGLRVLRDGAEIAYAMKTDGGFRIFLTESGKK